MTAKSWAPQNGKWNMTQKCWGTVEKTQPGTLIQVKVTWHIY